MGLTWKNNTAILVFANSSQEEARQKAIPQSRKLFDSLTEQTLKTVEKSKLPYFHFSENQQLGDTFGERFTNAIEAVFQKGYEHVITIGNDAPQLKVSHIWEAEKQLHSKKFVLGPSTDGGFYLMGLHRSEFELIEFKKLAWQTSSLYKQLFDQISKTNTRVFRLEYLSDIDTAEDIKSILTYTYRLSEKIRYILLQTLNSPRLQHKENSTRYTFSYYNSHHNKGSPVVLYS